MGGGMMDYISIVNQNNDGGFLIPDTEHGREYVEELMKEDSKWINQGVVNTNFSIHQDFTRDDIYVKYFKKISNITTQPSNGDET
jgi:hypothetical protein